MIEARGVTKRFGDLTALNRINLDIDEGRVFGLIGTNGAGKSTFMRLLSGVYRADEGEILVDREPVYDRPVTKEKIFFISDDQFFFRSGNPRDMKKLYATYYARFDGERWERLMKDFGLDPARKITTYSKGMRKQMSIICGLCSGAQYLLCDETFDGLDPMMRQAVKQLFVKETDARGLTLIIASHNLRELEDICDSVGLLHQGGVLLESDVGDMMQGLTKCQFVCGDDALLDALKAEFVVLNINRSKSFITASIRGTADAVEQFMVSHEVRYYEMIPQTLEDIFISETEACGYDIKNILN